MITPNTKHPKTDSSGFRYFSDGEPGEAHELAHRMLDQGLEAEGFARLSAWLAENDRPAGEELDSQWVHLHWHMAVFEIAVGRPEDAYRRYRERILPAVHRGEALTDAPSLLWRLSLAAEGSIDIEWSEARDAALKHLGHSNAYVEIHNLLALAGARELECIDRWLDRHYRGADHTQARISLQIAWALRTFANRDYEPAAKLLRSLRELSRLGGSRAQNTLWAEIETEADVRRKQRPAA